MTGFALGTRILMANGGFRLIEQLDLVEQANGGSVTEVCHGLSADEWYDHNGVYATGDQEAWIDGDWQMIKDAPGARRVAQQPVFYSIKTSTGRLFSINDTTFRAE
jgi:hypothetical protein